ncbi:MAG: PEP-CTERM sorting domain-containing protein, partial [Planctomycetota bacterium]
FRRQTNPDFVFDVRFSSQSDNTSLRFQFDELRLFGDFGRGREGTLTVPTAVTFARIAAVPEPGTLLLAGVGAACLARRRRG